MSAEASLDNSVQFGGPSNQEIIVVLDMKINVLKLVEDLVYYSLL
jgi:hypothetical protein